MARINLGIRRRLAPLLDGDRRRIELMNGLLMSLPGSPILYYGDEIGMGDNIYLGDRNGVRTPMQWNGGWNAGFSSADPERLYQPLISNPVYGYQAVNVESAAPAGELAAQLDEAAHPGAPVDAGLRPRRRSSSCGPRTTACSPTSAAWTPRRCSWSTTSRAPRRPSSSTCRRCAGAIPIEMFGRSLFPRIGELPYVLTLGPYDFFWFRLRWL